jgi:hypothetical protein
LFCALVQNPLKPKNNNFIFLVSYQLARVFHGTRQARLAKDKHSTLSSPFLNHKKMKFCEYGFRTFTI